jgi:hypothetical protein
LRPVSVSELPWARQGSASADELGRLARLAGSFPSMGSREIGSFLRKLAREAPPDTAIVEVGSWLGAGTAQLALGVCERAPDRSVTIHAYDRWRASESEVGKALLGAGLRLSPGEDTLPFVMKKLRPFGARIIFTKGELEGFDWSGRPISVYVDDAAKVPSWFYHVLRTFGPSWIPGDTVLVLMDFHHWKKTGQPDHRCQQNFIEAHPAHFSQIEDLRRRSNAAFLYRARLDFENLDFSTLLPR